MCKQIWLYGQGCWVNIENVNNKLDQIFESQLVTNVQNLITALLSKWRNYGETERNTNMTV